MKMIPLRKLVRYQLQKLLVRINQDYFRGTREASANLLRQRNQPGRWLRVITAIQLCAQHGQDTAPTISRLCESEKGLPSLEGSISGVGRPEPEKESEPPKTLLGGKFIGWEVFATDTINQNEDVLSALIHPCKYYEEYLDSKISWHKNTPRPTDFRFVETISAIEKHSWYVLLLKLVATKGHGGKLCTEQAKRLYGKDFDSFAFDQIKKAGDSSGPSQLYVQSVANYAVIAGRKTVPVNLLSRTIPFPLGHNASFSQVLMDIRKK